MDNRVICRDNIINIIQILFKYYSNKHTPLYVNKLRVEI